MTARRHDPAAVALLLMLGAVCRGEPAQEESHTMHASADRLVHRTWGQGRWFPAEEGALRAALSAYLDNADVPPIAGRIVSALAPHAGYVYSGPVAGYTFAALRANAGTHPVETVVILGFSHRAAFRGFALLDGDAVRSPLGETPLDREAAAFLARSSPHIAFDAAPHRGEHSAENEIPFVQAALPDAKLVVGLFGDHDARTADALLHALAALARQKRLVVLASTDLLHDPDYDRVTHTDRATLERIAALDDAGLAERWTPHAQPCCGLMPVLTAMRFARAQGAQEGTVLHYRNSGDDHPESRGQWVVGYGAVVFAAP
jgi:MEMO1 family protein